jgi:hypothetical protein
VTRGEIPPMWRVRIRAHTVAGRWSIPASSTRLPAGSAAGARLQVLRWAHADAGAPKWRPLLPRVLAALERQADPAVGRDLPSRASAAIAGTNKQRAAA